MSKTQLQSKLQKQLVHEGLSNDDAKCLSSNVHCMDTNNVKIAKVWAEHGVEKAIQQMFVDPDNGHRLSYAEMRCRYG